MEAGGFKNKTQRVVEGVSSIVEGVASIDMTGLAYRGIGRAKSLVEANRADAAAIQSDWEAVLGPRSQASPEEYAAALRRRAHEVAEREIKERR